MGRINHWKTVFSNGIVFPWAAAMLFAGGNVRNQAEAQGPPATSSSAVVLILDASGSMWEELDGGYKIRIAQGALKNLAAELSDDMNIGLIAYGHRRQQDCADIQTLIPLGRIDRAALNEQIDALNPIGRTPITASIREAIELLADTDGPASVVLVSDGIETCGGDPCQLVRDTRARGVNVVMHVVGFGVGEVDTSQLECTAQAGGGHYISASDAEELADALRTTVEAPPFVGGWLSVRAVRDGELMDVAISVFPTGGGEEAGGGRTYTSPETNPRVIPLPAGSYHVQVVAVGLRGEFRRDLPDIDIVEDQTIEHVVDFSSGELAVGVTRNGALSDAGVRVYIAGTTTEIAAGRTYTGPDTNPHTFNVTTGTYDVVIDPIGVSGYDRERLEGITVGAQARAAVSHEFPSGTLRVTVTNQGELADATVNVIKPDVNREVARGRTYTGPNTNPRTFELAPGRYLIRIRGVRMEGDPRREIEVGVVAGDTVERSIELSHR